MRPGKDFIISFTILLLFQYSVLLKRFLLVNRHLETPVQRLVTCILVRFRALVMLLLTYLRTYLLACYFTITQPLRNWQLS